MSGLLGQMRAAERARNQGLLSHTPQQQVTGRQVADAMQAVGLLASPVPVIGDVAGLLGDAAMYAAKPEERTLGNFGLTALGALPFVPPLASAKRGVLGDLVRRGRLLDVEHKGTFDAVRRKLGKDATEMDVRNYIAQYNASLPIRQGGLGLDAVNTPRQRADAGGFGRDVTVHETAVLPDKPVVGFDPQKAGESTGVQSAQAGVFSHKPSERPALEQDRSQYSAYRQSQIPGSAQVSIPLLTRGRFARLPPVEDATREAALADMIRQAQEQGYDALQIPFAGTRQTEYVASKPSQLRLPWAAFDPAQRESSNLLAGIAPYALPAGLLGAFMLTAPPADASQR